jgi:hypothetical protein
MTYTPAHDWSIGEIQIVLAVKGADWNRQEIKIGKCRSSTDEGVPSNNTHLQASILGDHAVVHQCCHK